MKGISSLERIVIETLGKHDLGYEAIQQQTGIHANVCFNILQALIIRGIITTDGIRYRVSSKISPLMMEEINGISAKQQESMEIIESVIEQQNERVFRFQKIAMDERDEKIFLAMLSNLESFLKDAHKKSHSEVPMKNRKVVFWGMAEVQTIMKHMIMG
jgi:DNA-binding IclR family transcriptional regulator